MSQKKSHSNKVLAFLSAVLALAIIALFFYTNHREDQAVLPQNSTTQQSNLETSNSQLSNSPSSNSQSSNSNESSSHSSSSQKSQATKIKMSDLVEQYNANQLSVGDTYETTVTLSDQGSWYPLNDQTTSIYVASENDQAPQGASLPVYTSPALAGELQSMTTAKVTITVQEGTYSQGAPDLFITAINHD